MPEYVRIEFEDWTYLYEDGKLIQNTDTYIVMEHIYSKILGGETRDSAILYDTEELVSNMPATLEELDAKIAAYDAEKEKPRA